MRKWSGSSSGWAAPRARTTVIDSSRMRRITLLSLCFLLLAAPFVSAADVADSAMRGDREAVRAAIARKADVNAAQVDGTTALHWAAERDDLVIADLLIKAARVRWFVVERA